MGFNPEIHHRHTIRMPSYDYSTSGYYHVVVCTYLKQYQFGDVIDHKMQLNELGEIANNCWQEIPSHFPNAELDEFIVMPNHIHGIIVINNSMTPVGAQYIAPLQVNPNEKMRIKPKSLSSIVRTYKGAVKRIIGRLGYSFYWQRNYYDHIIRNDEELNWARYYIRQNPVNWDQDKENPAYSPKPIP